MQGSAGLRWSSDFLGQSRACDDEDEVGGGGALRLWTLCPFQEPRADLLKSPLRSEIVLANHENDPIDESECVVEHEGLQLTIVGPAPEGSLQECPPDLHFAFRRPEVAVSRAADDSARRSFQNGEGAPRFDRAVEISPEYLPLISIALRMLLPDQRIFGGREQRIEIARSEGTDLDQVAPQGG